MSLYFEASRFLVQSHASLKSRVFSDKNLKSQPAQIYALVVEARKWSPVLTEIIENARLLTLERKLTPELALLLVHDLLLTKRGISAPSSHKLRASVHRNKARLQAELTKARIKRKCATLDELKDSLITDAANTTARSSPSSMQKVTGCSHYRHARWVRVNRLKSTLDEQMKTTFSTYDEVDDLKSVLMSSGASSASRILHIDKHVPDLIALPPNTDLSKERAYLDGKLIIQDKASCFPAYLLDPRPEDEVIVDGCAAPGNKTTHLASLRRIAGQGPCIEIVACERDKSRAQILQKMIKTAGAENSVTIKAGQDFLRADPHNFPWCNVGALLLDPSCSGSGIIGRDEETETVVLPSMPVNALSSSKKRKREESDKTAVEDTELIAEEKAEDGVSKDRLNALSSFQKKIVLHALGFPKARKVTYSTCSIHDEENEHVVAAVLKSEIAKRGGWKVLERKDQVDGMKRWHMRGRQSRSESLEVDATTAGACIRCEKHTADGTQGFFVAGFVRDAPDEIATREGEDDEEEWGGFDD